MRAIYLARLDKVRPVLVLTREPALTVLNGVTVAPITSTIRGIRTEVPLLAARTGLDHDSVANCDTIVTITRDDLLRRIAYLPADQEPALHAAIVAAFELLPPTF